MFLNVSPKDLPRTIDSAIPCAKSLMPLFKVSETVVPTFNN